VEFHPKAKGILACSDYTNSCIDWGIVCFWRNWRIGSFHLHLILKAMKPIKTDPIKTVLTITVGFLVIYFFTEYRWLLYTSLIVGVLGLISTRLAEAVDYLWMKLSYLLSLIVPNILLTIIFYVFLFPISMLSKLFSKKDPMDLKNSKQSLFRSVEKAFIPESFDDPW
jgi:hypothetical protein